jgi:hypothetical protein
MRSFRLSDTGMQSDKFGVHVCVQFVSKKNDVSPTSHSYYLNNKCIPFDVGMKGYSS